MIAAATPQHLPGVLHSLEPTLNQFGYLAVVGLVLIEDFGVPVPGETVLILAAVYAGTGRLNIVLVGVARLLWRGAGRQHRVRDRPLRRASARPSATAGTSSSHPSGSTKPPASSNATAARSSSSRGSSRACAGQRHHRRHQRNALGGFLVFNAIGAALWVAVWTSVGYFSGSHINTIYNTASRYSVYLAIVFGAGGDRAHRPARGAGSSRPDVRHLLTRVRLPARHS